jgi:hypothetical protein
VWSSSTSFSTTATYRQPGFEIEYSFSTKTANICSKDIDATLRYDGGLLMDDSSTTGDINVASDHCQKTIVAGPGQQIEVTFKRLSLADSNDCVEFYEGASPDKKHLTRRLAEFCGRRSKGVGLPAAFRSETNTVTVDWDSDKSSSDGFEMAWKFVEKEGAAYSVCGGELIVAAAVSSTGVLRDRVAVSSRATSLFGARCVRAIKGPTGSVMSIKFNTFGLKTSSSDRFTVYRGEATEKALPQRCQRARLVESNRQRLRQQHATGGQGGSVAHKRGSDCVVLEHQLLDDGHLQAARV